MCLCFSNSSVSGGLEAEDTGELTDAEESQQLQFLQWSLPHLCAAVTERIIPLLKVCTHVHDYLDFQIYFSVNNVHVLNPVANNFS